MQGLVFYDRQSQAETKQIVETFRKNGTRRCVGQYIVKPDWGTLLPIQPGIIQKVYLLARNITRMTVMGTCPRMKTVIKIRTTNTPW